MDYHAGRFTLHTEILIQVPATRVRAILTDYNNLPRVNGGIKTVQILARDADRVRMGVSAGVCILFFCLDYAWVQDATSLPSGDIVTVIDPAVSDFQEGRVRYQMLPAERGYSRLIMDAELVPDFWFPPLIGPWLIKSKLRNEALETAVGVERLANEEQD